MTTERPRVTLHVLWHGVTLCNMPSPPSSWPEGHRWLYRQDVEGVPATELCDACYLVFKAMERVDQGKA